jgi:hypothetical protein
MRFSLLAASVVALLALSACPSRSSSDTDPDSGDHGSGRGASGSGVTAYCAHAVECGGKLFATKDDCIKAATSHWGTCRVAQLDTFGRCMAKVSCDRWNPDNYVPESTPCAAEYRALSTAPSCSSAGPAAH